MPPQRPRARSLQAPARTRTAPTFRSPPPSGPLSPCCPPHYHSKQAFFGTAVTACSLAVGAGAAVLLAAAGAGAGAAVVVTARAGAGAGAAVVVAGGASAGAVVVVAAGAGEGAAVVVAWTKSVSWTNRRHPMVLARTTGAWWTIGENVSTACCLRQATTRTVASSRKPRHRAARNEA